MLTIEEQLLYTTLKIECFDEHEQLYSMGTGFLLECPVGDNKFKMFLVSNRHVLEGPKSIAVTFTRIKDGKPDHGNTITVPIHDVDRAVVGHPNPDVDVAVLNCSLIFRMMPEHLYIKSVSYDMLSDFTEPELNVAENVLFVGYPDNRYDIINNLPLIRQGLIASHPKYNFNGEPVFIIDAQVFPGSSGSPVYIDLTLENMKKGIIKEGPKKLKLLGIVARTMIRNNKLSFASTGMIPVTEEVIGLGMVFKSTVIKEVIKSVLED